MAKKTGNLSKALLQRIKELDRNNRLLQEETDCIDLSAQQTIEKKTENLSKAEGNEEGVFSNISNTEGLDEGDIPAISAAQGKALFQRIVELERNNRLLQEEKSKLQEDIQEVSSQNEKQQQTITSLQAVQTSSSDGDSKTNSEPNNQDMQQSIEDLENCVMGLVEEKLILQNLVEHLEYQWCETQQGKAAHPTSVDPTTNNESQMQDMQQTIDLLQKRVMELIEEKLNLQNLVEFLEHRQVEVQFDDESNQQEPKKAGTWGVLTRKGKEKDNPPIAIDEKFPKADISEQIPEPVCLYDADASEVEDFDTSRETWAAMKRTTPSMSILDTISTAETNQAHFLETAMNKKKEHKAKPKAWGQKLGEMLKPAKQLKIEDTF